MEQRNEHVSETTTIVNLFDAIPTELPQELVQTLFQSADLRIERIVSHGHVSPDDFWYDQDESEWVLLCRGSARIQFEDRTVELKPGDFLNIPAHSRHRVEWTTPSESTIWLAIFYG